MAAFLKNTLVLIRHMLLKPVAHYECFKMKPFVIHASKIRSITSFSPISRRNDTNEDQESGEVTYFDSVRETIYIHPGVGHNVLIIQPRLKYGSKSEKQPVSELKLQEACALVKTLPNWKVVQMVIVPIQSFHGKFVFGTGNLENLRTLVQANQNITAVFIGIDIMTALQNSTLDKVFGIPVFDRYQIILQIFHDHAHTREAKLQLALAEIPYLRVKLCGFFHTRDSSTFIGIQHVGGHGETFMEKRRRILFDREVKLKKELEKVKKQREFLRRNDHRNSLPVVAVVGYTNCGKTSLIKSLTNDACLLPEDKLFATLDVTLHAGLLPSTQKVLYIDTVGFISDVPTALIQSFRSTLEEITLADLVVHVRDISHPNAETQKKVVMETLRQLDLSPKLIDSIIEIGNKVDLLENPCEVEDKNMLLVSATEGEGLPKLLDVIQEKIFENTDNSVVLLRIPNGGKEYSWIMKEAALRDAMVDPDDASYLIVETVISSANLSRFSHLFGDLTIQIENIKV